METNFFGGLYRNPSFTDIFPDEPTFTSYVKNSPLNPLLAPEPTDANYNGGMRTKDLQTLYYLLYGRYGNSTIASFDSNQFRYKLLGIIYEGGPTWATERFLRNKMIEAPLDELKSGSFTIQNQAAHDGSQPSTSTITEIKAIDNQFTTRRILNDNEALGAKLVYLDNDVDERFLSRFKKLFLWVVAPEYPKLFPEVD